MSTPAKRRLASARRSSGPAGLSGLRAVSIHHRIASIDELERMAIPEAALARLHASFREHGLEAVVLSTCNRTELYSHAVWPNDHMGAEQLLWEATGHEAPARERLAEVSGLEAAAHLFRVAAGLESQVVGEAEVLGQVRAALLAAEAARASGSFLSDLFRAALRFGARARSETSIGTGALSVASAAVRLLATFRGDLSKCTVLVVGTGATGRKVARHLRSERVGRLVLANRTPQRAQQAAAELDAEVAMLEDVPRLLSGVDAAVVAARAERPLLTVEMVRAARAGSADPLLLIDVSLPRVIDPACGGLDGVTLRDLSGLEETVTGNRVRREREVPRVTALLEQELRRFAFRARESHLRPLIAELRQRAETIRR